MAERLSKQFSQMLAISAQALEKKILATFEAIDTKFKQMTSQQEDILKQAEDIADEQDEEIQQIERKFSFKIDDVSEQMIEMSRVMKTQFKKTKKRLDELDLGHRAEF